MDGTRRFEQLFKDIKVVTSHILNFIDINLIVHPLEPGNHGTTSRRCDVDRQLRQESLVGTRVRVEEAIYTRRNDEALICSWRAIEVESREPPPRILQREEWPHPMMQEKGIPPAYVRQARRVTRSTKATFEVTLSSQRISQYQASTVGRAI